MKQVDVTIIGGGPGGYECALECARLGLKTALIEKKAIGGTCLHRGCIPTKTWIHASDVYRDALQNESIGIHAQATFDYKQLQAHKVQTIETLRNGILFQMKKQKVEVYESKGSIIDAHHVRIENDTIVTKHIVVATGSSPSIPPIPGSELAITSNELLDQDEPLSSLCIIGGGVIGVELAGVFLSLHTKVTILEALPSLLANLDKELGQGLKQSMKKKGADIHTSASVKSLKESDEGILVTYEEKGEKICLAQKVLIATGRKPYTDGLFENEKPTMNRGFIEVDEKYETSLKDIYAIGDVNGKIQLAHAASAQGRQVARHLAGKEPLASAYVPSCIYTTPEIASIGLTKEEAKAQGIHAQSHKALSSANGKSVLSNQERGFIKVVYEEETHRILGAQLMCARATDMLSIFTLALEQNMTIEQIHQIIYPHPSFSEMIGNATQIE